MRNVAKTAIIGGGVIGGGWAARFLLNGWTVHVFDPDADARRKIGEVLDNAGQPAAAGRCFARRRPACVLRRWKRPCLVRIGYRICSERLTIKHQVFADIQDHAGEGSVIASSTSGFTPAQLREGRGLCRSDHCRTSL